jgi:hypothetical protein
MRGPAYRVLNQRAPLARTGRVDARPFSGRVTDDGRVPPREGMAAEAGARRYGHNGAQRWAGAACRAAVHE